MHKLIRSGLRYARTHGPGEHRSISFPAVRPGTAFDSECFGAIDEFPLDRFTEQYLYEQKLLDVLTGWPLGDLNVAGYCHACELATHFEFQLADGLDPNWRESLVCQHCRLITRWRATAALVRSIARQSEHSQPAYITERLSPLYQWLLEQQLRLIGSEFVGPDTAPGTISEVKGHEVMHQDITRLSFDESSLSAVFTFDVLEHVPDFTRALREFYRVLDADGVLVISVPFSITDFDTVVRATQDEQGHIEHLLEPEFHGDPMNDGGVLCFYNFGWSLLEEVRNAGFEQVALYPIWDPGAGYLGLGQCFIVASANATWRPPT